MKNLDVNKIKANWKAGLTVALVSIPLSISLAVASQSTPLAGIITAIWAGLAAAIFGGSDFNIVGPTGALSGIITTYALANGSAGIGMLAIIAGGFILIAYLFQFERYLIFIPSSVIHGFTLGVAFIIGLNQLNFALGLTNVPRHEKFFDNIIETFKHIPNASQSAILIFTAFIIGLFILRRLLPKIPGAIILSPVGILLGFLAASQRLSLTLETLGSRFGDIAFKLMTAPHFALSESLVISAAAVALIAILETMLSAKIADNMTRTKHNERKEMFGLGIANILSGLTGGIPATAALARTSLNVKTDASHKVSAAISSVLVAIISLLLFAYFKFMPMAVIAAILVYVAVQMIEAEHFIKYYRHERSSFVISMVVAAVTVYEDPIVGILFGTAMSLILFVEKLSRGQFDVVVNKSEAGAIGEIPGGNVKEIEENTDIVLYSIKGKLCYINGKAHVSRFEQNFNKYKYVILRLREVYFMDLDGVQALDEIIELVRNKNQQILLTSVSLHVVNLLKHHSKEYQKLEKEGLIFNKTSYAIDFLNANIIPDASAM